jgi:periplasmic divalent cation tolerance protein
MVECIQVITTIDSKEGAANVAAGLLKRRLAACVQVVGPATSTYWWEGAMETAEEWLCIIKTTRAAYVRVEQEIRTMHPYDEPEILAVPVTAGSRS